MTDHHTEKYFKEFLRIFQPCAKAVNEWLVDVHFTMQLQVEFTGDLNLNEAASKQVLESTAPLQELISKTKIDLQRLEDIADLDLKTRALTFLEMASVNVTHFYNEVLLRIAYHDSRPEPAMSDEELAKAIDMYALPLWQEMERLDEIHQHFSNKYGIE